MTDKVKQYRERSYSESVPHLEARRRHYRRHFLFDVIFGSLVGAGSFAMIIYGGILGNGLIAGLSVAAFLVLTPIFVLAALAASSRYKVLFSEQVAPLFATGVYSSFKADTKHDIDSLKKRMSVAMKRKPDSDDASYYEGVYRGVSFFTFGYHYLARGAGHPRDAIGRYFEFSVPTPFASEILIKNRKSPRIFDKKSLSLVVKSESTLFEESHVTTSTDEEKARMVLTPLVLSAVLSLEELYQGHVSASFKGSILSLYLDDYHASFKLSLFKEVSEELLLSYGEEVLLGSRLVKAFGLK